MQTHLTDTTIPSIHPSRPTISQGYTEAQQHVVASTSLKSINHQLADPNFLINDHASLKRLTLAAHLRSTAGVHAVRDVVLDGSASDKPEPPDNSSYDLSRTFCNVAGFYTRLGALAKHTKTDAARDEIAALQNELYLFDEILYRLRHNRSSYNEQDIDTILDRMRDGSQVADGMIVPDRHIPKIFCGLEAFSERLLALAEQTKGVAAQEEIWSLQFSLCVFHGILYRLRYNRRFYEERGIDGNLDRMRDHVEVSA